jgi:cytochrome bd-type quinol oxidase subunit 2
VATTAHLTWPPAKIGVLVWTSLLALGCLITAHAGFSRRMAPIPFAAVSTAVFAGVAGTAAMFFPLISAPSINLYRVAASPNTLVFLLLALGVILPVTLGYYLYSFYVFRDRHVAGGLAAPVNQTPSDSGV